MRDESRHNMNLLWRPMAVLWMGMIIGVVGCAMPAVSKLAKPQSKPSQEQFSCGEKCPPTLREVPVH